MLFLCSSWLSHHLAVNDQKYFNSIQFNLCIAKSQQHLSQGAYYKVKTSPEYKVTIGNFRNTNCHLSDWESP